MDEKLKDISLPANRFALIIANYDFMDPDISSLAAPQNDAEAFCDVLSDPSIGGFKTEKLINSDSTAIKKAVFSFFGRERRKDDTLLFYYTGHGMKGDDGKFYFVARDTERKFLSATGVPAGFVKDRMEESSSKKQVLILDCCYGGAFMREWDRKADSSVCAHDIFGGEGRVVLTASDSMQYSFEGDRRVGEPVSSIYTAKLVEGLKTGAADWDKDGYVTHNDLQEYMYQTVREITPSMTPTIDSMGLKGEIVIASNPCPEPAKLPEEIMSFLAGAPRLREAAVGMLEDILSSSDSDRRLLLAARLELEKLAKDDSRRISELARRAIMNYPNLIVPDPPNPVHRPKEPIKIKGVPCPACNKVHSSLLKFCPETGKPVGRKCPSCQYLTIAGAMYCGKCGRDLSEEARNSQII